MNLPLHLQLGAPALGIAFAIGVVAIWEAVKAIKAKRKAKAQRLECLKDPVVVRQILSR